MAYAYIDKTEAKVLHVVNDEIAAQQFAKDGKYVETVIPHEYGYPTIETANGSKQVLYENGQAYLDGNVKNGKPISTPEFIQELLDQLK